MRQKYVILFLSWMICGIHSPVDAGSPFYDIPAQTIHMSKLLGIRTKSISITVNSFQISGLVTLKEYKTYLDAVRKDSSEIFYRSQLPDSSIGTKETRQIYLTDPVYEDYPVLGISWESAMNFCKWKTLKELPANGIPDYIYRLPNCSEWLSAYQYVTDNGVDHDFSKNYSDWLISSRDGKIFEEETGGNNDLPIYINPQRSYLWPYDEIYYHKPSDSPALKYKLVIGNSYWYGQPYFLYHSFRYPAHAGYPYIGFRYVKDDQYLPGITEYWEIKSK